MACELWARVPIPSKTYSTSSKSALTMIFTYGRYSLSIKIVYQHSRSSSKNRGEGLRDVHQINIKDDIWTNFIFLTSTSASTGSIFIVKSCHLTEILYLGQVTRMTPELVLPLLTTTPYQRENV
ncbi:hypothetical protein TNCV_2151761 [Trichonephila clavipes]|uniref:Uncharacterized protein n=1 Tax=Trichonephila clavipes TaxID=2585209 RepID=A0A8X6UXD9_TRICX|nr:hypothetical protein TNCV_2151761 [Trichonephila clavipes]